MTGQDGSTLFVLVLDIDPDVFSSLGSMLAETRPYNMHLVISCHESSGQHRTASLILAHSNVGEMELLHSIPCSPRTLVMSGQESMPLTGKLKNISGRLRGKGQWSHTSTRSTATSSPPVTSSTDITPWT